MKYLPISLMFALVAALTPSSAYADKCGNDARVKPPACVQVDHTTRDPKWYEAVQIRVPVVIVKNKCNFKVNIKLARPGLYDLRFDVAPGQAVQKDAAGGTDVFCCPNYSQCTVQPQPQPPPPPLPPPQVAPPPLPPPLPIKYQNLAFRKSATQSDQFGSDSPAALAVDGNTNGNWPVASTNNTAQAWWQVDLGALHDLREIVLHNRTDCCGDRLSNFEIKVSNDGTTWKQVADVPGTAATRSAYPVNTLGRYVRVQHRGTNFMSLAEVQVFGLENISERKPATQSSDDQGAVAARAVDGNPGGALSGSSVSATGNTSKPWWQVDLGAVTPIGRVVLFNRTDCCGDRLSNFDIQVSNDGVTWTPVVYVAGTAPAQSAHTLNATGRYVRVQLRGTNALNLAEVLVFGLPNMALSQPATQSSDFPQAVASRAVDGNTDGIWNNNSVTGTASTASPWWQVDLGIVTQIGQVVLHNRTDCCGERLSNFDIKVSNDGVTWTPAVTFAGAAPTRSAHPLNKPGRYVRVQLKGTEILSLAEVQVFPPKL